MLIVRGRWPSVYSCSPFILFLIWYEDHTRCRRLCILNILAQVVFTEAKRSVSVFVWNPHTTHRDQKRKQTLYCEPHPPIRSEHYCGGGLDSNMLSATSRPYQHCNAWNSIGSAWPPSLDHGRCLSVSPLTLYLCLSCRWALGSN